jgi:hypothetical protein
MILNGGNWAVVFNSITRSILVAWGAVLLVVGLRVVHALFLAKAVAIAIVVSAAARVMHVGQDERERETDGE